MAGLYSRYVFPRFVEWAMSADTFSALRRSLLSDLTGTVLEIGFGTGLNLPHYPEAVDRVVAVDPNPGMQLQARQRIRASRIPVEHQRLDGERLPFDTGAFLNVVTTWTLCSIEPVDRALAEIYRVLDSNGAFLFLEHGLSNEPGLQRWQHLLTPFQKIIGDGCHLNRDIEGLIRSAGFACHNLETFYMEGVPRIGGFTYKGVAIKPKPIVDSIARL